MYVLGSTKPVSEANSKISPVPINSFKPDLFFLVTKKYKKRDVKIMITINVFIDVIIAQYFIFKTKIPFVNPSPNYVGAKEQ